jgi:putative CocE/NonD family hydrolase
LSGPYDQAAAELGNNLLFYLSPPATSSVPILGYPRVSLFAATSASHADFVAKLVRVTAGGRSEFISIGIVRSSWLFRGSEYRPDTVTCWEFALEPTSLVLSPGERIGLEIASSAFPLYDRNPSTDVLPQLADNWNWGRSTQQILHTAEYPSALHLPIQGAIAW